MNTQDWSPLGWTGWISLQSQGLSRVFSNTTVQKYQFFTQLIILPRGGTRTLLCCCSVAQSCLTLCNPMDCSTPGLPVLHYLMEFAQTHVHTVGDAIQPSHPLIPFSSCLWSFPGAGSFPMSRLFASGGQSTGASTSASVLPMNIQGWSPLGLTRWISLQSKRLSRVFSNTTVQKDSALLLRYCFLTTLPLFMHSLTSLVNTCLNMSFGTQGRSRRLKPFLCKWETGDTESLFVPGGPHRVLLSFRMVPLQAELCPPQKPFVEVLTLRPS